MRFSLLVLCTTASRVPAQTFTTQHSFGGTDGANPNAVLIQATNGILYGTTRNGGTKGQGAIFKITPNGTLTTLYSFCLQSGCPNGANPNGLVEASDGNFYGTTYYGGINNAGTVFKITPRGTLTTLHRFCPHGGCPDGFRPAASLLQGTYGNLYGTTESGGFGGGTVFEITPSGTLTTLHSFCPQRGCVDGYRPEAPLLQATDGNFYGTTAGGGANKGGTIFKLTPSGTLTTLYNFCSQSGCPDGESPYAGLAQAMDGDLYGTTLFGGANNSGTIFKVTPDGTLTTLYSFCSRSGCPDGDWLYVGLVQATDGNLYGTTLFGGANNSGTIFKITTDGTLTTLYSFCSQSGCPDGADPWAALVQDTNGRLYGTTFGSSSGDGTVFSLSVGLGPFVETEPTLGKVGTAVKILGTSLKGATSVTFNGTAATFTVASASEITTTVPAGATTGKIQVATPTQTLTSNKQFLVP